MTGSDASLAKEGHAYVIVSKAFSEAMKAGPGTVQAKQALKNLRDALAVDLELKTAAAQVIARDKELRKLYEALVKAADWDIDLILEGDADG